MSLLNTLLRTYDSFFVDFRSGGYYDKSNNHKTVTPTSALLNNKNLNFNGSSAFLLLSSPLIFRYDEYWIFKYIWKCGGAGTDRILLNDGASDYMFFHQSGNNILYFFQIGGAAPAATFPTAFFENKSYEITAVYNPTTGVVAITKLDLSSGSSETVNLNLSTLAANWVFTITTIGKRGGANDRYFAGGVDYFFALANKSLTTPEIATLSEDLDRKPDQRVSSKSIDASGTIITNFKGELHALANERTLTSGQLENTPLRIDSGSHKMKTGTLSGSETRDIECVSSGDLFLTGRTLPLTGWSRYIDGVLDVTDLSVANTISLTTGQVLTYACKDTTKSLHNKP